MSDIKTGNNNPMYNKKKSREFIYHMLKDKKGINNPMYGKTKSKETLAKLSKELYIYKNNVLIKIYPSMISAVKDLNISHETLRKYKDTNLPYKDMFFYSKKIIA